MQIPPRTILALSSGRHGVEGHTGWGLQWLLVESGRRDALAVVVDAGCAGELVP